MDELLQSELPWQLKIAITYFIGTLMSVAILLIPKKSLGNIGRLPCMSPNWITFWRLPIFWGGVCIFFFQTHFWGLLIIVAAECLDITDGRMATAFKEQGIPRSDRALRWGELMDPAVDKLTNLPFLAIFSVLGIIHPVIATFCIMIDIIGTLMRAPFNLGQRFTRQSKATPFGKMKMFTQNVGFLVIAPYYFKWVDGYQAPNIVFSLALAFGVVSVLSRVRIHPAVDKIIDRMSASFSHEEFKLLRIFRRT